MATLANTTNDVNGFLSPSNNTATVETFSPIAPTWTENKKLFQIVTKQQFESALASLVDEGVIADFHEVEAAWTGSRWQGFRREVVYIGHLPDVGGYLKIRSGVDPDTLVSNPRGTDAIHLVFRRRQETVAHRRVQRIVNWRTNLRRAITAIAGEAA